MRLADSGDSGQTPDFKNERVSRLARLRIAGVLNSDGFLSHQGF